MAAAVTAATTTAGATLDVLSAPGSRSSLHSSTSSRNSLVLSSPSPSFNQSLAASRSSPPRTPSLSSSASASVSASSSSSNISVSRADQEDLTITAPVKPNGAAVTADTTFDDIQVLAVSSHITELSYAISDIQTRIFEIQELRHKTQSTNADGPSAGPSTVIDKSLSALDDRLTSVQSGISTITTTLSPLLSLPQPPESDTSELSQLLRKHAAFAADWEAVQAESDVLREELKEDKWLTVFRTVTEQADGMMASLEKAVNRCQDFIWQVHRHAHERDELLSPSTSVSALSDRDGHINTNGTSKTPAITLEVHQALLDSFEAKKKHYMPATTKVLSIIDKGVQDRVTKNGECLRRHAESTQRWKALRDRIARTDAEMDNTRRVLLNPPQAMSDSASSNAGHANGNGNGSGKKYLTPASKASSTSRDTLSRSMSPFRKLARHFGGSSSRSKLPATPTPAVPPVPTTPAGLTGTTSRRTPASEPNRTLRNRSSMFLFSSSIGPGASGTPPSPGHKYSASSAAVDLSSPGRERERYAMDEGATLKARGSPAGKIPWNSSTKVEDDSPGIARSRKPSGSASGSTSTSTSGQQPPYKRSLSRASVSGNNAHSRAPSRGAGSGYGYGYGTYSRPPSRAQTPTSTAAYNPRARPRTPSNIPAPPATSPGSAHRRGASVAPSDASLSTSTSGFVGASPGGARTRSRSRAGGGGLSISASMSTSTNASGFSTQTTDDAPEFDSPPRGGWRAETPGGTRIPHPRPPSRSMIPAPKLALSTPSRPGSAMSDYFTRGAAASPTPSTPFRTMAMRAQTPESTLRLRAGNALSALPPTPRTPSFGGGGTLGRSANGPPSSFREMAPSRAGGGGQQLYVPANARDPLEVEVAAVVNSFAHGMTVERVDPPLRTVPKDGEMKAQYAFSSVLGRKVLTVRLTTLARPGGGTGSKKVMVRVGGGWVDLAEWMSSRPA